MELRANQFAHARSLLHPLNSMCDFEFAIGACSCIASVLPVDLPCEAWLWHWNSAAAHQSKPKVSEVALIYMACCLHENRLHNS